MAEAGYFHFSHELFYAGNGKKKYLADKLCFWIVKDEINYPNNDSQKKRDKNQPVIDEKLTERNENLGDKGQFKIKLGENRYEPRQNKPKYSYRNHQGNR